MVITNPNKKMRIPLISIIIPVYNSEKYLKKCINSVLSQSYTNLEIILVNDGSTDGSGQLCDRFSDMDSRVKVVHKDNGGVASARNIGIENAHGKYITFIDSDDHVDKEYISFFITEKLFEQEELFVMQGVNVNDSSLEFNLTDGVYEDFSLIFTEFNIFKFGMPYSKLYNTNLIKSKNILFPIGINKNEDILFLLSYLIHIRSLQTISKKGYNYKFDTPESLSKRKISFEERFVFFKNYRSLSMAIVKNKILNKRATANILKYNGNRFFELLKILYRGDFSKSRRISILKNELKEDIPLIQYSIFYKKYGYKFLLTLLLKHEYVKFDFLFFSLNKLIIILR